MSSSSDSLRAGGPEASDLPGGASESSFSPFGSERLGRGNHPFCRMATRTTAAATPTRIHCRIGPHRVAGVSLVLRRTWLSRYAGWKKSVRISSPPSGAITALIPVVPATTTYLSCSTARTLANASCCSLIVLLKVALLLGTVNSCAPPRIDFRGARSKITSQQVATPTGTPAMRTTPVPLPGTKWPARSA
ncbi:Uncharacterised protein [Mycobacterium tuberculosis]|nr:Uncharacterised protein [Mycobacterium tuberculosis]COW21531.1 Uncharacterised protein [Mycobacterium tuberculosis]